MPLTADEQDPNQLLHYSAFLWAHLPGTLSHCDVADLSQEKMYYEYPSKNISSQTNNSSNNGVVFTHF